MMIIDKVYTGADLKKLIEQKDYISNQKLKEQIEDLAVKYSAKTACPSCWHRRLAAILTIFLTRNPDAKHEANKILGTKQSR